jgi:hypothetical protein
VAPELPETSDKDAIPFTTAYFFPSSDAQPVDPNTPLQMAHSTMIPNATHIPPENTVASQTPIGTPRSPRSTPSLPLGYNVLNDSIPIPTQIPTGASGVLPPLGHNLVVGFIPTLPRVPSGGFHPPFPDGASPSGVTQSFTPNHQTPVGRHLNPWGQPPPGGQIPTGTQPSFGGQIPTGTHPLVGGQPPPTPPYGQNIPVALAQYWNYLTQGNPQLTRGQQPQFNSQVPPVADQPYPGSSNPIWGLNVQPNIPSQGNTPNQYNPMGCVPPHQHPSLPESSHYMQTAYGPTGLPTGLPPQIHQYSQVNRQLLFISTLDLSDLLRILNDPIHHSPQWPAIPSKLPSNIPKFDDKVG